MRRKILRIASAAAVFSGGCGGGLTAGPPEENGDAAAPIDGAGADGTGGLRDATAEAAASDGGASDGNTRDALGQDGGVLCDGATLGDGGIVYNDLADPCYWTTFDTSGVNASAPGVAGSTFDGRYVYFAPSTTGIVTRLDTQADFGTASSWSIMDVTGADPGAKDFMGTAFDGRYVYFVPGVSSSGGTLQHVIARYDIQQPFTSAGAWTTFDTSSLGANAAGFAGAAFDGRYIYLAPNSFANPNGVAAQYDTQAAFSSAASWSTFSVESGGLWGGVGVPFDGRYVYFVSEHAVSQYDTLGAFGAAGSWTTVTSSTVGADWFAGDAFDGRYMYMWWGKPSKPAVRYDTMAAFTSSSSWSTFTPVEPGAQVGSGAFDGRFVYLVVRGGASIGRYDTQSSFTAFSSWSSVAVVQSLFSGVFDGRYLYFSGGNSVIARFDARTRAPLPKLPGWSGSFF